MSEPDKEKKLKEKFHNLLFAVRRSIRYHTHRRKFFERFSVTSDFLVIVSGGTVVGFASASGPDHHAWTIFFGAFIAVIGSLDLVIGFSNKARDYRDLARDFSQLEMRMMEVAETYDEKTLITLTNRRLEIEQDEPPTLRVLDSHCHNELIRSMGYSKDEAEKEKIKITFLQSVFMQWFDWYPSTLIKNGDKDGKDKSAGIAIQQQPSVLHI